MSNKMHQISDLYKELNLFSYIFCLSGTQYFTLNQLSSGRISGYFKVWFLVVFCMISAYSISRFYFEKTPSLFDKTTLLNIWVFFIRLSDYLNNLILLLPCFLTTSKQMKVFRYCKEISEISFFELGYRIDYKALKVQLLKTFLKIIGIFLMMTIFIIYSSLKINDSIYQGILQSFHVILFKVISTSKFVVFVSLLNFHLQKVEILLKNLVNNCVNRKFFPSTNDLIVPLSRIQPYSLIEFNHKLICIKKMYGIIYKISKLINDSFAWINFGLFVSALLFWLITIFSIFMLLQQEHGTYEMIIREYITIFEVDAK